MTDHDYNRRPHWTKTAIDCYMRGCVCQDCPIYEQVFKYIPMECQMKSAVIASVRKLGILDSMKKGINEVIKE